jgi:uncharacterized protein
MTVASALLQRHIETLLSPGEWETLIADDILWELPFAPALGHPGRLEGREAVETHSIQNNSGLLQRLAGRSAVG